MGETGSTSERWKLYWVRFQGGPNGPFHTQIRDRLDRKLISLQLGWADYLSAYMAGNRCYCFTPGSYSRPWSSSLKQRPVCNQGGQLLRDLLLIWLLQVSQRYSRIKSARRKCFARERHQEDIKRMNKDLICILVWSNFRLDNYQFCRLVVEAYRLRCERTRGSTSQWANVGNPPIYEVHKGE